MKTPELPSVETLRQRIQSLATLEVIISTDWDGRYHSFNSNWAKGEMMGSMRDGSGDDWHCLFREHGAIFLGLAHEAPMRNPAGLFKGVPSSLAPALNQPAFSAEELSFCIWRSASDTSWHRGPVKPVQGRDPDGSFDLLALLDGDPRTFVSWAAEYYEVEVPLEAVRAIYAHEPLSAEVAARISSDRSFSEMRKELLEIGYPLK